ncbi:TPA: DUF1542 domain-containing protein [Streptococcus suis]|nr:DUF1542 domain-containing protein [Streptococcus suis]
MLEIKTGNNSLISDEANATEYGLYGKANKDTGEAVVYGKFDVSEGEVVTWYVETNDGTTGGRRDFYLFAYGVEKRDEIPVRKSVATGVTAADIIDKLIVDLTKDSGNGRLNSKFETKFNANYVAVPTGKNTTVTEDQKAGKQVWHEIEGELPTTAGVHTVTVKSTNIHGQVVRNNITVELYKLKDISRDTVDQYTDNPVPIHAIVELGSTGDVGTVKLEGVLPESFKLENFNLKDGVATELAKRNLEFVKATNVTDGVLGTIRAKNGGKVEYTGSGNIDYGFVYSYMEGTETKTVDLTYTILFTDRTAPVMTPAAEYVRVVGENYTISVSGSDNAFLNPDKINGTLSVLKSDEAGKVSPSLGTNTDITSELDPSGKDISGGSDDQGGNSTKFNIKITGTAPATAGTGSYKLRVGEDNFTASPSYKEKLKQEGKVPENVSYADIKVTFVDKVKPITPIPVADQSHLTPTEKKAVIDAVKEANPNNAKLQALPESAFTVNSDGSVSVNYSGENVDGATDTIKNATTKLAGTQNEAKAEIDRKLAENKKAIEAKRDATIAEIDDNIELTYVQKEAAKNAITAVADNALKDLDTKATEAKENIDKATTVSEIDDAKVKGEFDLDGAKEAGEKAINWKKEKEEAKAAVETQLTDALEIINNNPNLSYEEKKAYFDAIGASKKAAIEKIDEAKDSVDITAAIEGAVKASETEVLKAAKQDALNKLEKDAAKAKEDVADNSNLTKEQLEKALEDIQNDFDKAKTAVNEAATPDAVQKEEDKGVAAITKDVLDATKQNALNQLEKDAARAKEDVAKNPNLTKEQLEKALEGIQNDLDKAKTAINEAATSDAVQEEMNKGVTALAKDVLDAAKQDAKNKIDKEAESAKTAIDASPNLTPEEKDVAKKAVEEAAKVATDAIDKATNLSDVQTAEDNGVKAIDAEELKATQKDAKNKIAKEAESAKKAIDTNLNLTPEEKESAKKVIDTDAQAATAAIDKASTPDAVQVEEDKGVAAINLITAKADAKGAVAAKLADEIKKLEDKQAEAEKAIDASTMTEEEKAIAKKALQDVVDKGKAELEDAARVATNEIHKATTAEDAKAATLAGEKSLTDTGKEARDAVEWAKDKELAKEAIRTEEEEATRIVEKLAENALKAINSDPNLSDEDKQAEIKKLTDVVTKTLETIHDNATKATQEAEKTQALADLEKVKETQKIADKAAIDGLTSLVKDGELEAMKQDAKNKIAKDAAVAKEAIGSNPNLTDAEKKNFTDAVDAEVAKANDAISAATSPADVQKEEDAGVAAIAEDVLDAAKQDAKNKIAKEVDAAKEAIDANPNLSDAEKEASKKAVDADAKAATDAIDASTSPVEAQSAEDKGVGSIAQDVLDAAKQDAKNKIAKEVVAAKEAIASNPNLTDAEKKTFTDAVDADAKVATDAIDKASTPDAVQAEEDKGVAAITKDVLDAAKQDAKNKIAKEAAAAKEAIASNPNLTDAEKKTFTDAVDADAKAATDAIDASTSPVEAQSAEDKGVGAIAKDVLDAAKQDAKNKIAKEVAAAKEAIDTNPNLTDAAKEAAKSEIDKAVEEAIVLINGVRTHQELEKIKLPMAALIKPAAKVTPVVDPNNLTEKEIARIKAFLKENNNLPEGTEINVSKDASVTIKYPDGTIDLLSPVEVVKQADKTAPTVANDGKGNIVIVPSEKAVEIVVSYVDNNGKPQTVVVTKGTDGLWTASNTVVIVDPVTGQVIVPGSVIKPGTVVTAYSKDEVGNSSDSAEAEVVAVDENNSAAGVKVKSVTTNANNVEKKAKQLPNTGEEANSATSLGLVALGLGLALLAAKRRRDEEA